MRKLNQTKSPEKEAQWATAARIARAHVGPRAQFGHVMQQLTDAAAKVGVTRATISNYFLTLDFANDVGRTHPEQAAILRRSSWLAADAYRRWFARDPEVVLAHILSYERDNLRQTHVMAAERQTRPNLAAKKSPHIAMIESTRQVSQLDGHLSARPILSNMPTSVSDFASIEWSPWSDRTQATWMGITKVGAVRSDDVVRSICIVESRAYRVPECYRPHARQLALQASAASHLFDLVVVVLPDTAAWLETVCVVADGLSGTGADHLARFADVGDLHALLVDDSKRVAATSLATPQLPASRSPVVFCSPETFVPLCFEPKNGEQTPRQVFAVLQAIQKAVS